MEPWCHSSAGSGLKSKRSRLALWRCELEKMGQELVYVGRGFGGLRIQAGGGKRDVLWGPRPTRLEFKPHGQYVAEITWSVEVALLVTSTVLFAVGRAGWAWVLAMLAAGIAALATAADIWIKPVR